MTRAARDIIFIAIGHFGPFHIGKVKYDEEHCGNKTDQGTGDEP
jgi:hypothetical protein